MKEDKNPSGVNAAAPETETELEAFRQKWREEVSARNKKPDSSSPQTSVEVSGHRRKEDITASTPIPGPSVTRRNERFHEALEPRSYHDLPDKEDQHKLGTEEAEVSRAMYKEPTTALEHYEKAVEKETQGILGESMKHYRRAFKLDDGVHEAYKRKHFPPSSFPPAKATASSSSNAGSRSDQQPQHAPTSEPLPSTLKQLLEEFSTLRIEPVEPPTSASPPEKCPIAALPEEIVTHIISDLAVADVTSLSRLSQVCKRLAFLVLTEESIWKRVAMESSSGFLSMHYDYAVDLHGQPIDEYDDDDDDNTTTTPHSRTLTITLITDQLLHTHYASSWRQLFRTRPRIRFNGCYISTVNYTRAGAASTNSLTWGVPIHIVTYFRYLRFFRDGACVSLLTTAEPADVVHHLTRANLLRHRPHQQQHQQQQHATSALPSAVMRDALRGRWRLSGPASSSSSSSARAAAATAAVGDHAPEPEGDLFVETEGVVPKYTYKMHLGLAHAGKGARNNKLAWKGFWSHNKLTDDWAEFGLRNDRGFYWSRVKSYGVGE